MEHPELHRPGGAGGRISPHEGTAEKHVLSAYQDRGLFGGLNPATGIDSPIRTWTSSARGSTPPGSSPSFSRHPSHRRTLAVRLVDQRPHRETPNQSAGCCLRSAKPMEQPRQGHPGRLARSGRGNQNLRPLALGKILLPFEGARRPAERGLEELVELSACGPFYRGGKCCQVVGLAHLASEDAAARNCPKR